jgi:hypothetical protein
VAVVNESDYKTALVKQAKAAGWYARRIEDKYGVGFPDIVMIPNGWTTCFIEAKIVTGIQISPSPRQFVELVNINENRPYARALLLGIEPLPGGPLFYYSPPVSVVRCSLAHSSSDFVTGLLYYLEREAANEQ